jgi:hypothetical protein
MAGDQQLKNLRNRSYLNKDFDSFRGDLLRYARTYFGDKIQDFSEPSVGGLLLDLAASVSDAMSFYLDHQFRELSWSTAVESSNITRMIAEAGIKPKGASPAVVTVSMFFEVPAIVSSGEYIPDERTLPKVLQSTLLTSTSGVTFTVPEDVDFAEKDRFGNLKATYVVGDTDGSGNPLNFLMRRDIVCISGRISTENFQIGINPEPFFTVSPSNTDISEVLQVVDSERNTYYEVQALSQDTVFRTIPNVAEDSDQVPRSIEVIPAPRRFVHDFDLASRRSTIRFGGGSALTTADDAIPDPETLALPLYGTSTISRFSIDPNSLLNTKTLGVKPENTTISVTYRHGGGASHNVAARTIRGIQTLLIEFPDACPAVSAATVRASFDVRNDTPAAGGSNAPSLEEVRGQIPAARNQQERIVTKEDLISRIYTLPTKLGRVYRAATRPSPDNPLASQLFICSKDSNGFLTTSTDTLKKNLRIYLNEYRLISDAIDILDTRVINFRVKFTIFVSPNANKSATLQSVISRLSNVLTVNNFQIDQPVMLSDLQNVIINTSGVLSLVDLKIESLSGNVQGRVYSDVTHNVKQYTRRGVVYGPPGSIFELRYPSNDIVGTAL